MVWSVCSLSGDVVKYIRKNKKYVVGRLSGDIIVNEKSVSRKHAVIYLDFNNDCLIIEDCSKFGSFINQVSILQREESVFDGDIVQIGCQPGVNFKIKKKLISIKKQNLTDHDSQILNSCLDDVGGQIIDNLNESVDVMVMTELQMDYKVAIATSKKIPMVTVQYFLQLIDFYDGILKQKPEYSEFVPQTNDSRIPQNSWNRMNHILKDCKFYIISDLTECPDLLELIHNSSGALFSLKNIDITVINQLIATNAYFIVLKRDIDKYKDKLEMMSLIYSKLDKRMILEDELIVASIVGSMKEYGNANKECDESFLGEYQKCELVKKSINLNPYNGLYKSTDDILKILETESTTSMPTSFYKENESKILSSVDAISTIKEENQSQVPTSYKNDVNQTISNYRFESPNIQIERVNQVNPDNRHVSERIVKNVNFDSSLSQLWQKGITFKKEDSPNTKLSKLDKMIDDLVVPQFPIDSSQEASVKNINFYTTYQSIKPSVPMEGMDFDDSSNRNKENISNTPSTIQQTDSSKFIPPVEVVPTNPIVKEAFSSFNAPSKSSKNVATLDLIVKSTTTTAFQSVPKTKKFKKVTSNTNKDTISFKPHN